MARNVWLDPTIPPSPHIGGVVASWSEHCFAPAPTISVILNTTTKIFIKTPHNLCLIFDITYTGPVPQENRVSAGRYQFNVSSATTP